MRYVLPFLLIGVAAVVALESRIVAQGDAVPVAAANNTALTTTTGTTQQDTNLRLVVVVSVDQLCQEYFDRFHDNLDENGLYKSIERYGAIFNNCHHAHAFTLTAPGHAVQLTGCYPNQHGIIGNDWYDPSAPKKNMYCVTDTSCTTIGVLEGDGPCSPKNLKVPTVGDTLKISRGSGAKVIGVSLKDRAAILMTGHMADAAYWFEEKEGVWATSSYYRQDLPPYIRAFNTNKFADRYAKQEWKLALPTDKYRHHVPDDYKYEAAPGGWTKNFPHIMPEQPAKLYEQLRVSPFGNEMTIEVAKAILENEELGKDDVPDMLCINLSSNDYVGHAFGPHSLEVEDITYRTDRMLGEFHRYLCEQIGSDKFVMAVTADHGVCPLPELLKLKGIRSTGRDPLGGGDKVATQLEALLRDKLQLGEVKEKLVRKVESSQLFLNVDHPTLAGDNFAQAQRICADWLRAQKGVHTVVTREDLLKNQGGGAFNSAFCKTFYPQRSGDVLWAYQPYYLCGGSGTTHGSPWRYDTHVPLMFWGAGIKQGLHNRRATPAMLAPTVSALLKIDAPAACVEEPLVEALLSANQ